MDDPAMAMQNPGPLPRAEPGFFVDRLRSFPDLLDAILADLPEPLWRWKPGPDHWAIAEILGHLAREEREDFRPRLERTLRDPTEAWPTIDPQGDVTKFKDLDGDPRAFLDEFAALRRVNLAWLASLGPLDSIDWHQAHHHPKGFTIRAGDLLASWADHDTLHARQLIKRRHQLIERAAGSFGLEYAGAW
jgi:hypothetical protein